MSRYTGKDLNPTQCLAVLRKGDIWHPRFAQCSHLRVADTRDGEWCRMHDPARREKRDDNTRARQRREAYQRGAPFRLLARLKQENSLMEKSLRTISCADQAQARALNTLDQLVALREAWATEDAEALK